MRMCNKLFEIVNVVTNILCIIGQTCEKRIHCSFSNIPARPGKYTLKM